jgi:hypothetical protein
MIKHLKSDFDFNYSLFEISFVSAEKENFLKTAIETSDRIKQFLNVQKESRDITWFYQHYNVFTATCGDKNFYKLFVGINQCIREYLSIHNIKTNEMLYLQSWMNIHDCNEILTLHDHGSPIHGYISIDPKQTKTVFTSGIEDNTIYEIENFSGLLYLGPGKRYHKVENLKEWEGQRLTIAFDINDEKNNHLSFIPILI